MRKFISYETVQFLMMYGIPILAAWGAFHLAERYETAEMMRTAPHDGLAGLDVLAAGLAASVAGFFISTLLMYLLIRHFGEPSE